MLSKLKFKDAAGCLFTLHFVQVCSICVLYIIVGVSSNALIHVCVRESYISGQKN